MTMNNRDVSTIHQPVLLEDCVRLVTGGLSRKQSPIIVDCTLGLAGHATAFLKAAPQAHLVGIDRDAEALALATERMKAEGLADRFIPVHAPFDEFTRALDDNGIHHVDAAFMDLGLSSLQIDETERGFSYSHDAPLDMRMDPTRGQSAAEWLQTAEEADIAWVLKTYGEERFAKRIARAIVERNREQPMTRTKELAEVVAAATPVKDKFKHPATRTFQAVRIWVNSELEEIEQALKSSLNVLAPGGRLSIISFHSLEDRIVKRFMRENSRGPQVPAGLPMTEEQLKKLGGRQLRALGKLMPGEEEVAENPRARSSVLRIAERTNA